MLLTISPIIYSGCDVLGWTNPTPPPAWEKDVRDLFIEETTLPKGWRADTYLEGSTDPRANHVRREFSEPTGEVVIQEIWRAYTNADAADKFSELTGKLYSRGWFPRFPSTNFVFPPISHRSKFADEWGLTCGVDGGAECLFGARYRNYAVLIHIPLQEDEFGGLDLREIEYLLEGVDLHFAQYLSLLAAEPREAIPAPSTPWRLWQQAPGIALGELLLDPAPVLPPELEVAFASREGTVVFEDGMHGATRNWRRNDCLNAMGLTCYATQFVSWYPSEQTAKDQWTRQHSGVETEGPAAPLGVLRIADDIPTHSLVADEQFVACYLTAGGEVCEAVVRYGHYLLTLQANTTRRTGSTSPVSGLTHAEFSILVEAMDAKAASLLKP